MDLVKRLEEYRDRERELQWEGTFAQYFEIATKKPAVIRLAHERIYHMMMDTGVETTRFGGRDLGLTMAKMLVELHGGRLSVENIPSRGSDFKSTLPLQLTK